MHSRFCKYCKQRDHQIDQCPTITCRKCHKRGHPTWHCPAPTSGPSRSTTSTVRSGRVGVSAVRSARIGPLEEPKRNLISNNKPIKTTDSLWNFISRRDESWSDML